MVLAALGGKLEQLTTIEEIWERALEALAWRGIDFAIYLTVDATRDHAQLLTNIPEIYGYADPRKDPFLDYLCNNYAIHKTGARYVDTYAGLSPEDQKFINNASETGFITGLAIPMRLLGSDRFGGFNLGSRLEPDVFEAQIMPYAEELRFFCLLLHRRIEELAGTVTEQTEEFRDLLIAPPIDALEQLSPREQEIIYLVAQGVTRKECARLCGISPNTVAEYTKSAYRKLGVRNRVEATRVVMGHEAHPD